MKQNTKDAILSAVACAVLATGANAQVLEEVTVTATKRDTNLQDTPIAISAFSAEVLADKGVTDIRDLAITTPGLVVGGNAGFDFPTSIRGISSLASGIGADLPVGVYVDGVYYARGSAVVFGLVNLERIEVLKGPQGTLFGRNSTAGAIHIITRTPSEETSAFGEVTVGRYDELGLKGGLSGSVIDAKLYGSISGLFRHRGAFQTNQLNGQDLNIDETLDIRGVLHYDNGGPLTFTLRADKSQSEPPIANKGIHQDPLWVGPASLSAINRVVPNIDLVSNNSLTVSDRQQSGVSLTVGYDFRNNWSIKSITSSREVKSSFQVDTDGGPIEGFRSNEDFEDQEQIAQEFQFVYEGERLKSVMGLYYFSEEAEILFKADNFFAGARIGFNSSNETTSLAIFNEATYSVTDRFDVTLGIRYTDEEKDFTNRTVVDFSVPPDPSTIFPGDRDFDSVTPFVSSVSWTNTSPRAIFSYDITDAVMAYVSWSQGFKSGGHNFTAADPAFNPEEVDSFEIGLKARLLDQRVRVDLAAYSQDYQDLQVRLASGPGQTSFRNASDASIDGFEIDVVALLSDGLRLEAGYSNIDATYEDYVAFAATTAACPGGRFDAAAMTCDLSGNVLSRAPEDSLTTAVQYTSDLANGGEFIGRVSYSYDSEQFYNDQNDIGHDDIENVDAFLAYVTPNGNWKVKLWGKNLTDERYFTNLNPLGGGLIATPNVPRTYGVTFSYEM